MKAKASRRTTRTKMPGYFAPPVMAMALTRNDGTIFFIAYNYVEAGKVLEKWNLPVVCSSAALLGGVACGGSMLMLCMCPSTIEPDSFLEKYSSVENLTYRTDPVRLVSEPVHNRFLSPLLRQEHTGSSSRVIRFVQFSQRTRPRFSPGHGPSLTWSLFQELSLASCGRTASLRMWTIPN